MAVTLNFTAKINGTLIDVDSCELEDQVDDFGVRRTDTLDTVVAAGTTVPRVSLGTYEYTFAEPEPLLTYEYTVKIVYNGTTYYFNRLTDASDVTALIAIPSTDFYTSQAEVLRASGEYAIDLMMDDYNTEQKGYIWAQFLGDADETIKMYIMQHYDPDTLYENLWIRRRATWMVCNLLSQRRANNPLFHQKVERTYEELDDIRNGRFRIPGATVRHWQGPMWRNYVMQNRFYKNPVRVDREKSNRQTYSNQHDLIVPFFYISN